MASKRDFLVEIGTEELPPKSLPILAEAFAAGVVNGLGRSGIAHGEAKWYATPRRLAVQVTKVSERQPDQAIRRQGPSVAASFDTTGQPTRAALGFAASCGVSIEQLTHADGPKGKVLQYEGVKAGEETISLLAGIVSNSLQELPIARRMRWGAGDAEFVRPVHWVVMLFGADVVDAQILGIRSGRMTRGHRFHSPREFSLSHARRYLPVLERARVIADFQARRARIRQLTSELAASVGGHAVVSDSLLDEVTALVEWPVPLLGRFDERFLTLPPEVPVATMQDHQRYFPVRHADGRLMNCFITVSNIESRDPAKVRQGNERVIRPRLSDAAFFWEFDRRQTLGSRIEALGSVTFQARLGSLYDKTQRVRALASNIARVIDADPEATLRSADLAKCDLLTSMVGEFPELQGLMGKYYARADGESEDVGVALEEQYRPRFAGDALPGSRVGLALAMADRLDTIAGIFAIGQRPSGARDPFGIRRAALGVLRMCIEAQLDVDLHQLIESAVRLQPVESQVTNDIIDYFAERLRGLYLEDSSERAITPEMFDAVLARRPASPLDFAARLQALEAFVRLPDAQALSAANKRIANILRKADLNEPMTPDAALFAEPAERELHSALQSRQTSVTPMVQQRRYTDALSEMAHLRAPVDAFFDQVMVMADDEAVRRNRLALLSQLRALFTSVADLSRLPG